jgi:DNA-binding transcriptional LysR family regulator
MDVSLKQIRSFVAVARQKSFTRAASLLHLSQPTLTVQIRRLEVELGLRLLDRNTRSVDLTRIGREMLPVFETMMQEFDGVLLGVRDVAEQRRGIVKLAALPSVAAGALPEVIRTFRENRPGVSFVLKDVVASRVLGLVRAEEADLGVMGGEVAHADIETIFTAHDQMHAVFPAGHPIESADSVTAVLLASYPLVMMDPDTSVRAIVDAAFNRVGLMPSPACEVTYIMTAIGMVRAGLGLTILPGSAREILAEPSLRSRPIEDRNFSRDVTVIKKAGRTLPPLSETFAKHLVEALKSESVFARH